MALLHNLVSRPLEAMYSITSKFRYLLTALTAIALAGVITPVGAFAVSANAVSTKSSPSKIHQVLQASQLHPQLAIPGDIVDVTLRTGMTQVLLNGPTIPQISADALPGTFIFTFIQKTGRTLIDIRDFGILDGDDALIRPMQFDDGTKSFYLSAGQKRTVKVTSFMAVGTGTLRWAPLNHYVTDWQFVEETA